MRFFFRFIDRQFRLPLSGIFKVDERQKIKGFQSIFQILNLILKVIFLINILQRDNNNKINHNPYRTK